jgi:hypothetical protein
VLRWQRDCAPRRSSGCAGRSPFSTIPVVSRSWRLQPRRSWCAAPVGCTGRGDERGGWCTPVDMMLLARRRWLLSSSGCWGCWQQGRGALAAP